MATSHIHEATQLLANAEHMHMCAFTDDRLLRNTLRKYKLKERVTSPTTGLYVRQDYWSRLSTEEQHLHIARALQAKHPNWVFYGPTAALAYGFAVPYNSLAKIHVMHTKGACRANGLIKHRRFPEHMKATLSNPYIASDIAVPNPAETILQCLCTMNFSDGLCIADSALRVLNKSKEWLLEAVKQLGKQRKGIVQARLTASFANPRAESGGESIARARIIELGFALPELQAPIFDPLSQKTFRADFLWILPDGRKVAGELDGRQKYCDPNMTNGRSIVDVMADERLRESRISRQVSVMRFSFADVCNLVFFDKLLNSFDIPHAIHPFMTRPY